MSNDSKQPNITHIPVHEFYKQVDVMYQNLGDKSRYLDSARHGIASLEAHLGYIIDQLCEKSVIPKKTTAEDDIDHNNLPKPIDKFALFNALFAISDVIMKAQQPDYISDFNFNIAIGSFLNTLGITQQYNLYVKSVKDQNENKQK